ncbi:MAG: hypothetical protein NT141_03180 [candidate division WWE3 bacterium]|nr:hypothetical protein [candidate division WWE3 bacterium]
MKLPNLVIKIFIILVFGGGLAQLILVNNSAGYGSQISRLTQEQTVLNSDIADLNNQLAKVNSLENIQDRATRIGLARVGSNFEYLSSKTVAVIPNATP